MILCALGGLLAVLLSAVAVEWVRRFALRHGILDRPSQRSSHVKAVPRGGGVVIVTAALGALLGAIGFDKVQVSPVLLGYIGGALVIAGIGWLDDLRSLPGSLRLLLQLLAAALVLATAGWWHTAVFPLTAAVPLGPFGLPLALLWIVGLTNAYNFMDGIDGIAASQAVATGLGWAVIGRMTAAPAVELLGWAILLSSLGFLLHNWSPARIFMGDVGSGYLGYTFAALPFLLRAESGWIRSPGRIPIAAALLVWPFVFDALFTFLQRLRRRESLLQPHRSHLYQRLVVVGRSHRWVATLYACLAASGLVLALGWWNGWRGIDVVLAAALPLLFVLLLGVVALHEHRRLPDALP
jgi:UDP-N-acetylmuramyl pentapeptide phosphotransferase/UDP-N-acetylglucosamine-1-phosphate transferase